MTPMKHTCGDAVGVLAEYSPHIRYTLSRSSSDAHWIRK